MKLQLYTTYLQSKTKFGIIILMLFFVIGSNAQVTWTITGCSGSSPTIDKVFVDACADPEGQNEFAYMTVGNVPYDWTFLEITGSGTGYAGPNAGGSSDPSFNNRPVSSGFTSSQSVVNQLNSFTGCATPIFAVAPNPLPCGAAVIIRMSGAGVNVANAITGLCGLGPVYVLTGSYTGAAGFFRNGNTGCSNSTATTNTNPCKRIADFDLGNGCIQRVEYNAKTFPVISSNSTGGFLTSSSGVGSTSSCYEIPACSIPPAPILNPTKIEYCDGDPMPSTKIACSNCITCQYYVYDSPSGGNLIYSGDAGTWPNAGFIPPVGYNTYYIEQKKGFCNSARSPVQINRKPKPVISPIPDQIFCESTDCKTINVVGTSGATYTWIPATGVTNGTGTTPTICNTGIGVFTLKADLNGCTSTTFVNFSTNTSLNTIGIANPTQIDCINATTTLNSSPKGTNFTYQWTNGANTATPTVSNGGTYKVTITDSANGCSRIATTNVVENKTVPTIGPLPNVSLNCTSNSKNVTVTAAGSGLTYMWTPAIAGNPSSYTFSNPGTYAVKVTDPANGCTDSKSFTISEDKAAPTVVVNASSLTLNCYNNGQVTLNGNGSGIDPNFTYSWIGPNGYSHSGLNPPPATQGGTYTLLIYNPINGCSGTKSVTLTQNNTPPNHDAGSDKELSCYNPNYVDLGIWGSNNLTYKWNTGSTDGQIRVTTPGTYTLTVTDTNTGCTKVSSVNVTEDRTVPVISPINSVTVTCANPNPTLTTSVTGGTSFTYNWSPSGSGANPTVTMGGAYTVTVTNTKSGCTSSQSVNVAEDITKPDAVIAPPDILNCFNSSSITLNTTGTSTGVPYTYQWTGAGGQSGTTLPFPNITQPGTYALTVTNPTNGCTKTTSVTVTQNITPPNASAGPPKLLNCSNNGMVSIGTSSNPAYNYQWSNGATTGQQTVLSPDIYKLTVTDPANGCVSVTSVTVSEDKSVPSITSIPEITITCANPTLTLNPVVTGNNLVYTWSPNGTGATPSVSIPGTYTLTLTDNISGCTDTKSVVVSEDKVNPDAVIATPNILNCYNSSSITLDPTGTSIGASFTYNWSGVGGFAANTLVPPNVTKPGIYTLTVTNTINGCTKTVSTTVIENIAPPTATAGLPKTLNCYNNNSVSIGAPNVPNYTYIWSNGVTTGAQTITVPGTFPATYELTVTDVVNGCTRTSQVVVSQDDTPPTTNAGADITINCYQPSKNLLATASNPANAPMSYNWSGAGVVGGGNTLSPTVNQAGPYVITVTNTINGCTATATVNVTSDKQAPTVSATVTSNLDCNIKKTTLDANGTSTGTNFIYQWSGPNGFTSNTIGAPDVIVGGAYVFSVTNTDNGCSAFKTVVVNQDITPPSAAIVAPTLLSCDFPTVILQPISSQNSNYFYTWTTQNGNFTSGTSSYSAQADKAGIYELTVINTANGCTATANTTIVEDKAYPTAIANPVPELTCSQPLQNLDGNGSSTGNNFSYTWSSGSGSFTNSSTQLNPTIDKGGTYTLTVRNTTNGCISQASVVVVDNRVYPTINIQTPKVVTCKNPQIEIDASSSTQGSSYIYTWTPLNSGIIVSGANTLTPVVSSNGAFQLEIKNTISACKTTQTIIVNQDKVAPSANAGPNKLLTCTNKVAQLNGSGSTGSNFTYTWGTSGGTVPNSTNTYSPTVTQAAIYTLTVTNIQNGCTATSSTNVTVDTNVPKADAGLQRVIDCNVGQVNLDGTKSDNGASFTYTWTTANGSFVSGQNTLQPTVNKPGNYDLLIKNTINNCEATASVEVFDNRIKPKISVEKPKILNCAFPQISLNAKNSSSGVTFIYQWTSTNGNIVAGSATNIPQIDRAGNYIFKIIDTSNGCSRDTNITVLDNFTQPKVVLSNSQIITCVVPTFALDASTSINTQTADIQWKLRDNANVLSGASTLKPIIDNSGFYKLVLRDTLSQCMDSLEIEVKKDANIPNADAGKTQELNCNAKIITLNATASASPTITYAWGTNIGNIVSGSTTLSPVINQPGEYTLTVTDAANQCVKTSKVVITQDTIRPNIDYLPTKLLTCKTTVIKIDAAASSTGSKFKSSWADPQNGIISGATSLTPLVNKPGIYTLKIVNSGNQCERSLPVTVIQNIILPTVNATAIDTVTCRQPLININGAVNASSGFYTFDWTSTNGNIAQGANTLTPKIDKGGTFTLSVVDTVNSCVAKTQIDVYQNTKTPKANAAKGGNLTCAALIIDVAGTIQNADAKDSYQWTTVDGNIVSGATTPTIKVDVPGTYYFKVENNTNGCFTIDTTLVTQDANVPLVSIIGGGKLDCKTTSYVLDGSASSQGTGITFEWTTANGANILSGKNTLKPTVNGGGIYTLTIKNSTNNCVKSVEKILTIDTVRAAIDFETDILTCANTSIWIGANISKIDNYDLIWSSQNTILTRKDSSKIKVSTKGNYNINVTNKDNFCVSTRSLDVKQDIELPLADAGEPTQSICNDTAFVINATKSSQGQQFTYEWSSQKGIILANGTTLTPKIKPDATYKLLITNTINGCKAEDTTQVLNIKPKLIPAIVQYPLCHGGAGSITFKGVSSGTPPFVYSIDNGKTYNTKLDFEKLQPDTYTLKVQDANACEDSTVVSIIEPPKVEISIPAIHLISIGEDAEFRPEVTPDTMTWSIIRWTPADSLTCGDCLTPKIIRPFRGGQFELFVQNDKGCSARAKTQLNINRNVNVYAPTSFSPNGDNVNDFFTLFGNLKAVVKINYLRIYDRWGTAVFDKLSINPNEEKEGWNGTFRDEPLNQAVFVWYAEILRVDGQKELIKGDVLLIRN